MCPRDAIQHPQLMRSDTWSCILQRLDPAEVFRVVIAGYGEATTHPRFFEFIDAMRGHPVRFDMVSNGHLLTPDKLAHLDGVVELLMVSFSSIDPQVYRRVHVVSTGRVMQNLQSAQAIFKHTRLGISLTPMPDCVPSLPTRSAGCRNRGLPR
jgi:MoaA/NifB/PqqE/SkfB family radical SAM enzyme